MPSGNVLRVEVLAPATVRWSTDGWRTQTDTPTRDSGFGVHYVDLRPAPGETVVFTLQWTEGARWEGTDFEVGGEVDACG